MTDETDQNTRFSDRLRNKFGLQPDRELRLEVEQTLGVDAINHQLDRAGFQQLFSALDDERRTLKQ